MRQYIYDSIGEARYIRTAYEIQTTDGPARRGTLIAIQEELDGNAIDWMEHLTDDQHESSGKQG